MRNQRNKSNGKRIYLSAVFSCVLIAAVFAGIQSQENKSSRKESVREEAQAQPQAKESDRISAQAPTAQMEEKRENLPAAAVQTPKTVMPEQNTEPAPDVEKQDADVPMEKPQTQENKQVLDQEEESEETLAQADTLTLAWPVKGDILLGYSPDKAIYDITLEQYRTNDSISIAAEEGVKVKAAAAGTVEAINTDAENGTKIVITHNNGWKTTYSQLQGKTAVQQGDTVAAGQVIGYVDKPTKYSVLLGSHLDFQVIKDNATLDPMVALSK